MVEKLKHYQDVAGQLIDKDKARDSMLLSMEKMWNSDWRLPEELSNLEWVHKVVSTDPHDALRTGQRTLSTVEPRLTIHPLGPDKGSRRMQNNTERALMWHYKNASRRGQAATTRDIVLSALTYDEVCAQVVYLPWQQKTMGLDSKRMKYAKRFGPFAIIVRNPRSVHTLYSDWMPEAVLYENVERLDAFTKFWGEDITKKLNPKKDAEYVTVYDYQDLDVRVIWAEAHAGFNPAGPDTGVELMREEHKLPFLPWVCRVGGGTVAGATNIPLLWSLHQAKQWDTQNVIETLMFSEAIAYASAPRLKISGPDPDAVEVDYGEPGRPAYVPPGTDLEQMSPPTLDTNLAHLAELMANRIGKSTVPKILMTSDLPSGTAFATANLMTQSGIKSLAPYKQLAEYALADVFIQMLYWIAHSGESVTAYNIDVLMEDMKGGAVMNKGSQYTIDPKMIDVDNLYIDVELTADVPTDRMARMNAATLGTREGLVSKTWAMESLGITDPEQEREKWFEEKAEETDFAIKQQEKQAMSQMQLQDMAMRKQMLTQQKMQQQQQGGQQPPPDQASQRPAPGKPPGQPGINGRGFNPAAGGTPPATANPNATREGQTGRTRSGEEISG